MRISNNLTRIVARPEILSDEFIEAEHLGSRHFYRAIQRRIQGDFAHCTGNISSRDGVEEHRCQAHLLTFRRFIGDAPHELEELRGSNNRVRDGRFFNELLLSHLRAEVAVLWKSVGPNYGQRNVMPHSRSRFVSEEVASRSLKELHHRCILERWRIRHVDDNLGIFQNFGKPLASQRVDTRFG